VYGYDIAWGNIYRVIPGQAAEIIARVPPSLWVCDFTVGPDGTIYVGYNDGPLLDNPGSLLVIPPGTSTPLKIIPHTKYVFSLYFAPDGKLYGVIDRSLFTIDTATYAMKEIARLSGMLSPNGLIVAEDGTAYVSTGTFDASGKLYKIQPDGEVSIIASFKNNGLQGLALLSSGEVIGVQRNIGGVQVINPAGLVRTLVEPSGLVTPNTLAFTTTGELLIVNDEAACLTIATPDGNNKRFLTVVTASPPQDHIAFSPNGWYVISEAAPGFPQLLNRYLPDGTYETLADDILDVSGVVVEADGLIYASATLDGQIICITPDEKRHIIADGLKTPLALASGTDGTLYAVTGGDIFLPELNTCPLWGDTIVSITKDGKVSELAKIEDATFVCPRPDGWIYVTAMDKVFRISRMGDVEVFASGFMQLKSVAFDVAGNMFVSDEVNNDVIRISGFPKSELKGTVTNAMNGLPIEKARVQVVQADSPFAGTIVETDASGIFNLTVSPGIYTISCWVDGYYLEVELNVLVSDTLQVIDLSLTPKDG
jgi:sugar lactone lactonase YvrE